MDTPRALTKREAEALVLYGRGYSCREIAERWGVSTKTLEAHLMHIRQKLGIAAKDGSKLRRLAVEAYVHREVQRRIKG